MKFLRSVRGVTKIDKIRSREIRKELGLKRLRFKLGRERLRWFGHMKRMGTERIPRREFEATEEGKRKVGRPREKWARIIQEDVEKRDELWEHVTKVKLWEDRKGWSRLVELKEEDEEEETLSMASLVSTVSCPR